MLTSLQAAAVRQREADFMERCAVYKRLLINLDLPFSVDLPTLDTAYGQQLFEGLLKLDKGLKARYDLLRTDEGRQKLVADTISTAGHEVVDQVGAALKALTSAYRSVSLGHEGWLHSKYDLGQFANWYELDLGKVLDALTIDWGSQAHVLTYFKTLGEELQRLRTMFRPLVDTSGNLDAVLSVVASAYKHRGGSQEPVEVDELRLHQVLLPQLQKAQVLGLIPHA